MEDSFEQQLEQFIKDSNTKEIKLLLKFTESEVNYVSVPFVAPPPEEKDIPVIIVKKSKKFNKNALF